MEVTPDKSSQKGTVLNGIPEKMLEQRTFFFLKIVDQMPVNSVFYFAWLKTESTKAYNTLSVNAYFQYTLQIMEESIINISSLPQTP